MASVSEVGPLADLVARCVSHAVLGPVGGCSHFSFGSTQLAGETLHLPREHAAGMARGSGFGQLLAPAGSVRSRRRSLGTVVCSASRGQTGSALLA